MSRIGDDWGFVGPRGNCNVDVEVEFAGGSDNTIGDGERLVFRIADRRGFISGEGTCTTGAVGAGAVGVRGMDR